MHDISVCRKFDTQIIKDYPHPRGYGLRTKKLGVLPPSYGIKMEKCEKGVRVE